MWFSRSKADSVAEFRMARASKSCGQPFIASLHLPNPDIPSYLEAAVADYLGRTNVDCPMKSHTTDQSALNVAP
jgi:hypothetical protein